MRIFSIAIPPEAEAVYVLPLMRGERKECYAITEAGPGSDVSGIADCPVVGTANRNNSRPSFGSGLDTLQRTFSKYAKST